MHIFLNEWLDYNEQKIIPHSYQVAWQGVACLEHHFFADMGYFTMRLYHSYISLY